MVANFEPVCRKEKANSASTTTIFLNRLNLALHVTLASVLVSIGCARPAAAELPGESVIVMRGGEPTARSGRTGSSQAGLATVVTFDEGVVVMRPAAESFMRETKRLVAEADLREQRTAIERAQEANRRLAEALAVAATAVARRSGLTNDSDYRYVWVTGLRPASGRANGTLSPVAPHMRKPR